MYTFTSSQLFALCASKVGTPVAQKVKRWPADLAVPGETVRGGNLPNRKRGSTAYSIPFSPAKCPDYDTCMTEILLTRA